mmetsp:Transcript_20104/g.50006  ORF Transcript_20104/g.50006 Transcript_20104/m.50006 type:complete len:923 (+) Transcript_20104:277-3045(+)
MADRSNCFRQVTRPTVDRNDNIYSIPSIQPAGSNDSSCNLSVSWIDIDTTTSETNDDNIDSHASFETNEGFIRGGMPIVVDDVYFGDSGKLAAGTEKSTIAAAGGDGCHQEQREQHRQQQLPQQENIPRQEDLSEKPTREGTPDENAPYVEIIDTHYESVEGYDWDGILDLRNRMKKQEEQQQYQQQQGVTALQWVTEFRLYLTDGLLEDATEEASLALDDGPRYEVVDDKNHENEAEYKQSETPCGEEKLESFEKDDNDFVEFVESSKRVVGVDDKPTIDHSLKHDRAENDEEYASLALSPLDVLTNSLLGTKAFHKNYHHHAVRLTELIVGGPSLKLGESSIERLARALACGGSGALRKLVLIVSAVNLPAMMALGNVFRATGDSLENFHFYASQTTERLVASRSRYKSIPAPCVLGPGISDWVDAWTSNSENKLRSLNLSRMDIGDEAAFALSRLLLAAPQLEVLNLAQDDFYSSSKISQPLERVIGKDSHPPLSFAGTKRLLESLILIEDIKKRSLSSSRALPLSCANLLELDLSGWVLEDEETEKNRDWYNDEDKAVDNFYDDYNYIDDGSGEDDFEFTNDEGDSSRNIGGPNTKSNNALRKNQRACCVIAAMLRVNTTLEKLVLAAEDSGTDANPSKLSGNSRSNRGSLSVRSTLAIARALRDHVSNPNGSNAGKSSSDGQRPLGSNLRALVLSTNYTRGVTRSKSHDASSWAIAERKRAVAKVFYQALVDRPIYQLRLEELSCTRGFKGLERLGGSVFSSKYTVQNGFDDKSSSSSDLRDQLNFFLQQNRNINRSLKNIDSFWFPRLSSLVATTSPPTADDEEDQDCHFVEIEDIDSESTTSAAGVALLLTRKSQKSPIPVLVLAMPALLAKAGKETSSHNVLFSSIRILATKTNVWEMSAEHRCEAPFRHQLNS